MELYRDMGLYTKQSARAGLMDAAAPEPNSGTSPQERSRPSGLAADTPERAAKGYLLWLGPRGRQSVGAKLALAHPIPPLLHLTNGTWRCPVAWWAPSHGEKGKDNQGFYSAGNVRTRAAPLSSTRLTAFPSNTLHVNYLLG